MRKLIICLALFLYVSLYSVSINAASAVTGWEKSNCTIPEGKEAVVEVLQEGEDPAPNGGMGMLRLWCGGPTGTANLNANAIQTVTGLDKTKKYRLTGDVKFSTNDTILNIQNVTIDGVNGNNINLQNHFGAENNGKWVKLSLDISPTNPNIEVRFTAMANRTIWLDNISLKEIVYAGDGESVERFGEELIVNGNFEADLDFEAPEEIKDIRVENMDSSAKITWTNPEQDFYIAYVYREGEEEYFATTADGFVVIDGLENEIEYTYIIKTADKIPNISEGISVVVKPVADDFKASNVRFSINGTQTEKLLPGLLKTSIALKNNGCADDFSAELIVILLKDGALVDVSADYNTIEQSDWREAPTILEAQITIPEGDGYSVAVYIWSGLGEMETIVDRGISL